jgi:hypothetical protein
MEPSPPAPCTGAGRHPLSQHLTGIVSTGTELPAAEAAAILNRDNLW